MDNEKEIQELKNNRITSLENQAQNNPKTNPKHRAY